jgi:putative endonuclease
MTERRLIVGRTGEDAAVQYLLQRGYCILERNYRCRFGEIDLVARDGDTLTFIEVKTRRSRTFGPAAAAVTHTKQRHLIKASQMYMVQHGKRDDLCRFDVVTIDMDGQESRIELIKDAFQPSAYP